MMLRIRLASNHLSIAAACTIVFGSLLRANARGSVGALWAGSNAPTAIILSGGRLLQQNRPEADAGSQYNPHCHHRSGVVLDF